MFFKRLLQILLFAGLFNPIFMSAQENYYYYDGQKTYISHQKGRYVINFAKEIKEEKKEYILSQNDLKYDEKKIESDYVIIESNKSEKDLKSIVDFDIVKSVTKLFTSKNENYDFTITNKIIVKKKLKVTDNQIFSLIAQYSPKKIEKNWLGERITLFTVNTIDELRTLDLANFIYESGFVEFSHPDFVTFNWTETNDTYFENQWNLSKINAAIAWNITTGSTSIKIAILDSGVESDHPDLDDNLVMGYDVVDDDNSTDPYGDLYHGTACAGIASAVTNNSIGIAGVGYFCKIMPIQFTHTASWANSSNFASGINWAWNNGAHIISISGIYSICRCSK
ncbi:MAG: S8 family serine peptidase [bacterium]